MEIKIADFGKDHWGLLLCLEKVVRTCRGRLKFSQMRCNPIRHPKQATQTEIQKPWSNAMGTRLKGYFRNNALPDDTRLLIEHDDFDCLNDLEENRLIIMSIGFEAVVFLPAGLSLVQRLITHQENGQQLDNFSYETNVSLVS